MELFRLLSKIQFPLASASGPGYD